MTARTLRTSAPVAAALAAAVPLLLAGCGEKQGGSVGTEPATNASTGTEPTTKAPTGKNLVPDGYKGRFEVDATVLESPDHGPQLCGAVAESYPPQCGGPDIAGWDWDKVKSESAQGTRWGGYVLTGTWDGTRFTLTAPPEEPRDPAPEPDLADFSTPCAEPDGGWRAEDPAKADADAQTKTLAAAEKMDGYAGAWIDMGDVDPYEADEKAHATPDAPIEGVLNFRFTGDLDQARADLREVWGGPLCVTSARHPHDKLQRISDGLIDDHPELMSSGVDVEANVVNTDTWLATEKLQRELDEQYGAGTVVLSGQLKPLD